MKGENLTNRSQVVKIRQTFPLSKFCAILYTAWIDGQILSGKSIISYHVTGRKNMCEFHEAAIFEIQQI